MEAVARVHVHPVVLLSIIDSYERRNEDSKNVVGTLLVPHKESNTEVSMDLEFGRAMLKLERQDYYMKYVKNPIFLLVDPNLNVGEKMSIKAYQSRSIGVPGGTTGTMFMPFEVNLEFYDAERCAVDMMVSTRNGGPNEFSETTDDLSYLYKLTGRLLEMLDKITATVDDVIAGKLPADNETGLAIARLLFATPKLDSDNVEELISSSFKDLLMVTYLTDLIRSHIKLLNLAH